MRSTLLIFGAVISIAAGQLAAAPCDSDNWQPTFVHDLESPDGPWFVTPQGAFVRLQGASDSWVDQACRLIGSYGLRDRRGYTDCAQYTRVQCGCSRYIPGNSTCGNFLAGRGSPGASGGTGSGGGASSGGTTGGSSTSGAGTGSGTRWGVWADRMNPNVPWSDPCNIQYVISTRFDRYDNNPDYRRVRTAANRGDADRFQRSFSQFYDDQPDRVVKMTPCYSSTRVTTPLPDSFGSSGAGHRGGQMGGLEYNTDRLGSDYQGWRRGTTPEACSASCQQDARCKAFTWVKPGVQDSGARCWLKDSVPSAARNGCCVSGVKTSAAGAGERRQTGNIVVLSAVYASNCGRPTDVVRDLAAACEGKSQCAYRIDHRVLGDPAYGCRKDYVYRWQCGYGSGRQAHAASVVGEASGKTARLQCD